MWYMERDDVLYHHGRKGQKWGERNGPPYPLNAEGNRNFLYKKAVREARSAKTIIDGCSNLQVGSLSTMITAAGEKYVSGLIHGHDFDWQEIADYDYDGEMTPAASEIKRQFDKRVQSYVNEYDTTREEAEKEIRENGRNDSYMFDSTTGLFNSDYLTSYGRGKGSPFNPDYGADGTTQNCMKDSLAMELAYQGYGVNEAGRQTYPSSSNAPEFWFNDAEEVIYNSPSSAQSSLESYGAGSSGILSMGRDDGTGHALHWAISNSGKLRIEDGQCGEYFDSMDDVNSYYGFNGGMVSTYRLDNKEPNWENMASDSVLRGTKVKNRFNDRIVDRW